MIQSPSATEIRAARLAAGLTQAEAAATVFRTRYQTWQSWETGRTIMPDCEWALFRLLTGQATVAEIQRSA